MLQYAIIAATALALALALAPQPHSDWLYYWLAAGGLGGYQRGGAGLGLLAILKWFELSPVVSGLALNLASAAALLGMAYLVDRSAWKPSAQLVAIYLWLISPFYGIVQLDLVAASMLAVSFWLLLDPRFRHSDWVRVFAAVVLGGAAVSTKPQLALVLWAMSILLIAAGLLLRRRWPRRAGILVAAMLAASFSGFAIDYALRVAAGQKESMRTSSAVTLYSGLLVSGAGPGCGHWSAAATKAAKSDLGKPLPMAIGARLAAKPTSHWLSVVSCKAPQILRPPPYALYWLLEAPNVRVATNESAQWMRGDLRKLEIALYYGSGLLIILCVSVFSWNMRRHAPAWGLIAPSWILAFWTVHAIFEIQGRYFLPMFVIAPILVALAAWRAQTAGSSTRES